MGMDLEGTDASQCFRAELGRTYRSGGGAPRGQKESEKFRDAVMEDFPCLQLAAQTTENPQNFSNSQGSTEISARISRSAFLGVSGVSA